MKAIIISLCMLMCFSSCAKRPIGEEVWTFPNPGKKDSITHRITVQLVQMGDAEVEEDLVSEAVNNVYNRYGIEIKIELRDPIEVPDYVLAEKLHLPQLLSEQEKNEVVIYIVPDEHLNLEGGNGYADTSTNTITVKETAQYTRTVSHELAHVFGLLLHRDVFGNLMTPYNMSNSHVALEDDQVITIKAEIEKIVKLQKKLKS